MFTNDVIMPTLKVFKLILPISDRTEVWAETVFALVLLLANSEAATQV
ncbi:hypothetical protein SALWKB12_2059 [Snodgrassella communis]|nr:hypothetical protein SALWKB12_2059 [Snodgrassella communis]